MVFFAFFLFNVITQAYVLLETVSQVSVVGHGPNVSVNFHIFVNLITLFCICFCKICTCSDLYEVFLMQDHGIKFVL